MGERQRLETRSDIVHHVGNPVKWQGSTAALDSCVNFR